MHSVLCVHLGGMGTKNRNQIVVGKLRKLPLLHTGAFDLCSQPPNPVKSQEHPMCL